MPKGTDTSTLRVPAGWPIRFSWRVRTPRTNVERCSIQRFVSAPAAGVCVFVRHLLVMRSSSSMRRPDQANGTARRCVPRLRRRRPGTMAVRDVFPRTDRPGDPLGVAPSVSGCRGCVPVRTRCGRCRPHRHSGASRMRGRGPILSKSVGGDKPQYPAAKSIRFRQPDQVCRQNGLRWRTAWRISGLNGASGKPSGCSGPPRQPTRRCTRGSL